MEVKGMKLHKKIIILGIILVLLIPVLGLKSQKTDKLQLMMEMLNKADADFVEGDISLGGVILDEMIDRAEMEKIGDSIKEELNIKGTLLNGQFNSLEDLKKGCYHKEYIKDHNFNQLLIQGVDDRENFITISLSSYKIEDSGETSLYINLINSKHFIENNDIILKVEKIFDKYDKAVNVTSCIVGSIDGNIDMNTGKKKILDMTEDVKGRVVEKYEEDGIVSYSIFSPLIDEYIYTGNRKMNMNIALRYNELEDKTYILIGTPIITIGY